MKERIAELVLIHPVPQDEKLQRRLNRLDRMLAFYQSKMDVAPENQAMMFRGFVSALLYAIATIRMYRKLTKQLAELAEVDVPATRQLPTRRCINCNATDHGICITKGA